MMSTSPLEPTTGCTTGIIADPMIAIDTVLVKLASRCNLNCGYCYVYNMGDDSWRRQPKRMSPAVIDAVATGLGRLLEIQQQPFSIVFHGGEPLLLGRVGFEAACSTVRRHVPASCGLHVQTNGLLLDDDIIDICRDHDVGISISIDGPPSTHDRHRKDLRGRPSHASVMTGIRRLVEHSAGPDLFTGVLAVVDLDADPGETYEFFKTTGTPSVDFLYRDGNFDTLPAGKLSADSTEYGEWMSRLLDVYLEDPSPIRIRVLDDMLKLILGGRSVKEGVGLSDYGILVIDTDGTVAKNDTLKSVPGGSDRFELQSNVLNRDLVELVRTDEFETYHRSQRPSSPRCLSCPELGICGAGMPAHRWSEADGFVNPSVFCADQLHLIGHMRQQIARRSGI